jgi:hypothetical protein
MPVGAHTAACAGIAALVGVVRSVSNRRFIDRVLLTVEIRPHAWSRLRFAAAECYHRLRSTDFYLYEGAPWLVVEWSGGVPSVPTVFIAMNTWGMENISGFGDRYPAVCVRRAWGEERAGAGRRPARNWREHQAAVRARLSDGRCVYVGESPLALRRLARSARHIVIYQDVWQPHSGCRPNRFLGKLLPLPLGGLRIAEWGDSPVRLLRIVPTFSGWKVEISEPVDPSPAVILGWMEREIRARPHAWAMWNDFLAYPNSAEISPQVA